jgi:alpha-galactosidase
MAISISENNRLFFLQTNKTSYVLEHDVSNFLTHHYWGPKIKPTKMNPCRFKMYNSSIFSRTEPNSISMDTSLFEYPTTGVGDFRSPALQIQTQNGDTNCALTFKSFQVKKGKNKIPGLPALFVKNEIDAETLIITLEDKVAGLEVDLYYVVLESHDTITRYSCLRNVSNHPIKINRALSCNMEFYHSQFDQISLSGAYGNEKTYERAPLRQSLNTLESHRGFSSHIQHAFIALANPSTSEDNGQIYSANLIYSGNFMAVTEVQQTKTTRMQLGLNSFQFQWVLKPKESFYTPEAVLVQTNLGIGELSRIYHKLYRECLNKGKFALTKRPLQINNWEGTGMTFDEEKIYNMAVIAADAGVELFVLDDGWFGKRDNDSSSLGDWKVYKNKLPSGLEGLGKKINKLGLKFGLWFEPEMISEDSDLWRAHPDWHFHAPGRPISEQRRQFVLDFSREDIRNEIYLAMATLLKNAPIVYIKWDMNRSLTEVFSQTLAAEQQQEVFHRYVLGLYDFLEKMTNEFPDIMFENCCSGGGRYDPGLLHYMPITWTSDTTDVVVRLMIQYGTSFLYPASTLSAHVSPSPNSMTGRVMPFETRVNCALFGTGFGLQLDITTLNAEEIELSKKAAKTYHAIEHIARLGDLYRISNPPANDIAWLYALPDKSEAYACWFRILSVANPYSTIIKFKGLNPEFTYIDQNNNEYNGDYLMNIGIQFLPKRQDFYSQLWHFKRKP